LSTGSAPVSRADDSHARVDAVVTTISRRVMPHYFSNRPAPHTGMTSKVWLPASAGRLWLPPYLLGFDS